MQSPSATFDFGQSGQLSGMLHGQSGHIVETLKGVGKTEAETDLSIAMLENQPTHVLLSKYCCRDIIPHLHV
jgi:hypothetical protein